MDLNQHSVDEFENDLVCNEPLLKEFVNNGYWQWLRFPIPAVASSK
jgi:hypothetical protein